MAHTIVITGANRGIGLEFTRQYTRAGWRVYAGCRQPERALELNQLAEASDGRLSVHPLDVTRIEHIQALAAVLGDTPVDLLLNNAGSYGPDGVRFGHNTDEAAWIETLRCNAIGPMKMMEALVENVAASELKLIASLSSKMASMDDNGSGGAYIYRSTKAALNAIMKSAAIDLAPRGITAVVLHPGWVRTDMGGPHGEIDAETSARKLRALLTRLTPADAGRFFDVDGSIIPW
ncbi:short-chain dehydrogenase/reductase SDR [Thioalkalivibrio sulfidiphilus HL-EbGr7]|uniref:Short-chain dehydrogenase/reductase SDR n=1 Tax=Thioalkalivibrio sulfidiphilus (strain HL-EbGR7) TaxID=396588 RepID=B8GLZ8_THISH|nr:SDR family oxidoreductase [Thioalkalivibrio sulfidiphilus]ACL71751.1 short-chain dehydrogenase/reductase SDR [Thioalkalivibrio sulfidiphilus HL-EbGr7]